jgi:hypothetical protein
VPFLLALSSIVLLLQPRLSLWQESRIGEGTRFLLPCGLCAVSVYGGYFGAGSGVMVLALLLLTVDQGWARANALKNVILGVADVVAAIGFAVFGPVRWAAVPLALGLFAGSMFGPSLTRRIPGGALRVAAAMAGLGLAIELWLYPRSRIPDVQLSYAVAGTEWSEK